MDNIILDEFQQKRLVESFSEAVLKWSEFDLRRLMASPVEAVDLSDRPFLRKMADIFPQVREYMSGEAERNKMADIIYGIALQTAEKIVISETNEDKTVIDSEKEGALRESFANIVAVNTKALVFALEENFKSGVWDEQYEKQKPNFQDTIYSALVQHAMDLQLLAPH